MIGYILSSLFPTRLAEALLLERVTPMVNSALVGVAEFRNSHGATVRVFYPAAAGTSPQGRAPVKIFRNGLPFVVEGYTHTFLGLFVAPLVVRVLGWLFAAWARLHPLAWSALPRCYHDLPPAAATAPGCDGALPLVVWSHGLTGTGCEHGLLAVALALRGNVVALVHHSDGSSSLADLRPGSDAVPAARLWYQHPRYSAGAYDIGMRQRQAEHRVAEVEEARAMALALPRLQGLVHSGKVVVGGFSFGAATAGLAAATNPSAYVGAVLIDGWWHIELKKIGVNQDLPLQVHRAAGTIPVPALFIGSEEFQGYAALNSATLFVQKKFGLGEESEVGVAAACGAAKADGTWLSGGAARGHTAAHVLAGTRHGNFMDAMWWLPRPLLARLGFCGSSPPHATYAAFVGLVAGFVEARASGHTGRKMD